MREILFRGKRPYDSWVYGNLLIYGDGSADIAYKCGNDASYKVHVDRETIGQYTGLKDKNGTKIFEGDILRVITINTNGTFHVKFEYGQFYIGICMPLAYVRKDSEIIGNIYDNPEFFIP